MDRQKGMKIRVPGSIPAAGHMEIEYLVFQVFLKFTNCYISVVLKVKPEVFDFFSDNIYRSFLIGLT